MNSPIKHGYFYYTNSSVVTKICYIFLSERPPPGKAVTKVRNGMQN